MYRLEPYGPYNLYKVESCCAGSSLPCPFIIKFYVICFREITEFGIQDTAERARRWFHSMCSAILFWSNHKLFTANKINGSACTESYSAVSAVLFLVNINSDNLWKPHSRYSFCHVIVMLWWIAQTSAKICKPTHATVNHLTPRRTQVCPFLEFSIFFKEGIIRKISYDRRAYESV